MISVVVRGPKKAAQRAAQRRGITLRRCRAIGSGEVVCDASCKSFSKVGRWFGEHGQTKRGRGYPPGTLLIYNSAACPSGSLGGPRRRRRRGR